MAYSDHVEEICLHLMHKQAGVLKWQRNNSQCSTTLPQKVVVVAAANEEEKAHGA